MRENVFTQKVTWPRCLSVPVHRSGSKNDSKFGLTRGIETGVPKSFSPFKKFWAFTWLLFLFGPHITSLLWSQGINEQQEKVSHFILLVDTTGPVKNAFFRDVDGGNEEYFAILKSALESNPYDGFKDRAEEDERDQSSLEYKAFNNNQDIVTLVFFHFPLKEHKIMKANYFYTFEELTFTRDFISYKNKIRGLITAVKKELESLPEPMSPIEFAKEMVFPFWCKKYKDHNFPGSENKKVDRIVLVTISDEDNHSGDFENEEDTETFKKWRSEFNRYFTYAPINKDSFYVSYNRIKREVKFVDRKEYNTIYFDYTLIQPELKEVGWNTGEGSALERIARRSGTSGDINISWKGDSGINQPRRDSYNVFIQWAQESKAGGPLEWQKLEKGIDGEISFNGVIPPLDIYIKKTPVDDSQSCNELKNFCKSMLYRGVITNFMRVHGTGYPFSFETVTPISSITYRAKEVKNNRCRIPPYYVHRRGRVVEEGNITDHKLIQIYKASGHIGDFSAAEASDWSRADAGERSKRFITAFIAIFALFLALMAGLFIYLTFFRIPKIQPELLQNISAIPVDFSQENRQPQTLAFLKLTNTRKPLRKKQSQKPFNLKLLLTFDSNPNENLLQGDRNRLLTIEKIGEEDVDMNRYSLIESGNFYNVELPQVRAEDQYKILLHPNAIRDFTKDTVVDSEITYKLKLDSLSGSFLQPPNNEKDPVPVPLKPNKNKDLSLAFLLAFQQEPGKVDIHFEKIEKEENEDFVYDREQDKYTLPYSGRQPLKKLFKISIFNVCQHKFSLPFKGNISCKVLEGITPRDINDLFYLADSAAWDGNPLSQGKFALSMGYGSEAVYYYYIKYGDMGENPSIPRDFQVNLLMNLEELAGHTKKISVTRSRERTEALIQIRDIKGTELIGNPKTPEIFNQDGELILSDISRDTLPLKVKVPCEGFKNIIENQPTELFTLRLRNDCNTRTGFYNWQISDIQLAKNDNILINEEKDKAVITINPCECTGEVTDSGEDSANIKFFLDGEKTRILEYNISFDVSFKLMVDFYPEGKKTSEVKHKEVDVDVAIKGCHSVIPNFLIIDFGTSAIAVENCDNSAGPDFKDRINALPLCSPEGLLKSEDGLLPSIMNINEGKILSREDFVTLPAEKSLVTFRPELLISAVKLMILEGERKIPVPRGFKCIDMDGKPLEFGGYLDLGGILKSAYKNLKANYIKTFIKDFRKLIITYPNVYNQTHKIFLNEILNEVFVNKGESVYPENIVLVSESNAVLYDYLKQQADKQDKPERENVLVCDVGGGTLDMSLAAIKWEREASYPAEINIVKRDGIAFAGESLDKAIALQVHRILQQYEERTTVVQATMERGSDIFSDDAGSQPPEKYRKLNKVENKEFFYRKIAKGQNEKDNPESENLLQSMFEFKYDHILQFKKDMSKVEENSPVKICLGHNGLEKGFCEMQGNEIPLVIEFKEKSFQSSIRSDGLGYLYLYLKKSDWLDLPYIKRYQELFRQKINLFFDPEEMQIPGNMTVILSGRTSLWPSIPTTVQEIFKVKPTYISGEGSDKKGVKLKRAVIDGALQKVVDWPHIKCEDQKSIGVPALHYKDKAGSSVSKSWKVRKLQENQPFETNLTNSPFFQLGIKTSMDFIPFIGGSCFERDHYCDQSKQVRFHIKSFNNEIGWKFFIEPVISSNPGGSAGETLMELPVDPRMARASINLRGTLWPLKKVQLPDVNPEDFDEYI